MSWFGKRGGFLLVVLSVVGWLLFANLGNVYLWQDEAETALVAKNLLEYGYPMAYDGKNLITQNAGLDSNAEHVWIWSPWLQFYVTAASFKLFGIGTLSARLPFALIGLVTVAFFYFAARELLRKERDARIATVILGTSIPFLLHARQARWYVLAVITSIWVLHAYTRMRERKRSSAVQIVGSSLLLFHSSYLTFLAAGGGIAGVGTGGAAVGCRVRDSASVGRGSVGESGTSPPQAPSRTSRRVAAAGTNKDQNRFQVGPLLMSKANFTG